MATVGKIVTLHDANGNIFPETAAKAVYLENGKTVEDVLKDGVSGGTGTGGCSISYEETSESIILNNTDMIAKIGELDEELSYIEDSMMINVKKFGAKGDSITDDTLAIQNANDYCFDNNLTLYFPRGVYKCTNGIERKCNWAGEGVPSLGTFPLIDDKIYLREGYKNKLKGSVLLFCGTGSKTFTTQRSDKFASGTYCIKNKSGSSLSMEKIAIIQDMNCLDSSGSWTSLENTNSSNYDYGYIIDDGYRNTHKDVIIFGYYEISGCVISGRETTGYEGDPDYNSFISCSFSGDLGVSIIGSQNNDGLDSGISGSRFIDCQIFSADHHSRSKESDYWGSGCIYIDGYTDASNANINGHYFSNCCIRSYCTNPLILDHASNVSFMQTVFETPTYGTTNSQETEFLATTNTLDVSFIGCRFSGLNGINKGFGANISKLILIGEPYDDICLINNGVVSRLGNENNKPFIQFTNDLTSKTNGIKIQSDLENISFMKNNVSFKDIYSNGSVGTFGYKSGGSKTIVDGAITIGNYSHYNITTDGTNIDLNTINGGFAGQRIILKTASNSKPFNLIRQTGNIRMKSDLNFTNIFDRAELEFDGTYWVLISFSDNG